MAKFHDSLTLEDDWDKYDWEDREPTAEELKAIERNAIKVMSCADILRDIRNKHLREI